MRHFSLFILLSLSLNSYSQKKSSLVLPSLIGDNMVLQQNTAVTVWGYAKPGQNITITATWKEQVKTLADSKGHWQTTLSTPHPGGPYTIQVASMDTTITLNNVLIGSVWLCSGQSNMEMPLSGWPPISVMHSKEAIDSSSLYQIRLYTVTRALATDPSESCEGKWLLCNPSNVKSFSATAYFFGRKMYDQLHIPIGLILSAWGGTPIEAWLPATALTTEKQFVNDLSNMQNQSAQIVTFRSWLNKQPHFSVKADAGADKWKNLTFNDNECALVNFNDDKWQVAKLPQYLEQAIGDFDGTLWYRKKIDLPEQMTGKILNISLGPIDDMDRVYVNGVLAGETEEEGRYQQNRYYEIPSGIVHTGNNTIAVRVLDNGGSGGIYGKADLMNISVKNDTTIPPVRLAGEWKFLPVAELIGNTFYLYDIPSKGFYSSDRPKSLSPNTPSILYNAMINPVLNYNIQGVIWYQGETNVGRADQYSRLLPLMIKNWRLGWHNEDLSFYVVQIAPYEYSGPYGIESAELKNAQASALTLKHTGLAVTLDLGVPKNIHPPFKMEVGERLAALALAQDFHIKTPYSGPTFKNLKRKNNNLIVQFDHLEGGLVVHGNQLKEFEIAGNDGKYYPAVANIVKNKVIVYSSSVIEPVSIRYCWHNGSEASLFNKAGMSCYSFHIQDITIIEDRR